MSLVDSIINTAKTYIGTTEGSNNHKEIIDLYNKGRYSDAYQMTMSDPWCCAFVVAMFVQCNASDIIPCYAACDQMIHTFKAWGRWKNRSAEVMPEILSSITGTEIVHQITLELSCRTDSVI